MLIAAIRAASYALRSLMLAMGDMRDPRRTHGDAATALATPPFADRRIASGVARLRQ
jgi:hypothetical protein